MHMTSRDEYFDLIICEHRSFSIALNQHNSFFMPKRKSGLLTHTSLLPLEAARMSPSSTSFAKTYHIG
jgi:hypothetical protein